MWEEWQILQKCLSSYSYYDFGNRDLNGNFQSKSKSSPFSWVSRYILFLAKLKVRERPFWSVLEGGSYCEITPKRTWLSKYMKKSLLYWHLKYPIPTLFFIRPPHKWAQQDMESYEKFVDRFQILSKEKNPVFSKGILIG